MNLIERAAALDALGEKPFNWNETPEEQAAIREWASAYNAIASLPIIEAVPLDALCEWLAAQDFTVKGEPIVAKLDKETWANVIRECVIHDNR